MKDITLRQYYAVHVDQPGRTEIAAEAGIEYTPACGQVAVDDKKVFWDTWWNSLTQQRRMELYAKVRVQMADALVAEVMK